MTLPGLVAANNLSDVVDRERAWDNLGLNISDSFAVWTPANILTALWLDAADSNTLFTTDTGNTLVSPGGTVGRWNDKSGNLRHVSQASLGGRPEFQLSSINGRQAIQAAGPKELINAAVNLPVESSPRSLFAVYQPAVTSGILGICGQGSTAVNGGWFYLEARSGGSDPMFTGYFADINIGGGITITPKIGEIIFNGTTNNLYRTGLLLGSAAFSLNTQNNIFRVFNSAAGPFNGSIGEVVFLDSAVDTIIRQKMEGYLAHKWALTASLPSDHPYKTLLPTIL